MAHDLVTKSKHMKTITNPFHSPDEQMQSLLSHISKCGKHAYFILYVCLFESKEDNLGHRDAVDELQRIGKNDVTVLIYGTVEMIHLSSDMPAREMGVKAPWESENTRIAHTRTPIQVTDRDHSPDDHETGGPESVERDYSSSSAARIPRQVEEEGTNTYLGYMMYTMHDISPYII